MGEAKRKKDKLTPAEKAGIAFTHNLINDGRLIVGGFAAWCMRHKVDPATAPDLARLRDAYMSGAEHIWTSIMATLDPDADPTENDMRRMGLIQAEIDEWRATKMADFAKAYPTKGTA
ncbi:hypothetical protein GA830_10435 [Mesorhizobium sp. NBSH29]|uniref:hypothetical protein n=1 Tax=Mesorhizobium sp. NBSH29 TaxID=2654249 RepID=UPI0018968FA1|nr:hypothetical protein [Mesorhizobium sp. NBSH29]QPC87112.1 hypothetical protein GA830_10435 [Mesorhizobium sp. NBSH29]